MTFNWIKKEALLFELTANDQAIGTLGFNSSFTVATAQFGAEKIILQRTGFFKSNLEIQNSEGKIIGTSRPLKWYSSTTVLSYRERIYEIKIRNNPLCEFAVYADNEQLVAYGLTHEKGKAAVRINTATNELIFHFILWYLFYPVAIENSGSDILFLTIAAAS
jgi:hypothetical protein